MTKWFNFYSKKIWFALLLVAALLVVMSVTVFAGSDSGSVTVRIEGRTETFVAPTEVIIEDFDLTDYGITNPSEDGMTVIQAIIRALEQNSYDPKDSDDFHFGSTGYMIELCGLAANSYNEYFDGWMFYVNDQYVTVNVNEKVVQDGDSIVVFFTESWLDSGYAYFDRNQAPVFNGDSVTLTLNCSYYDLFTNEVSEAPCADADIYINGVKSGDQTDEDGQVTLAFDEAGQYAISAEKRAYDDYYDLDLNVISRPYCLVCCSDYATVRVEGADSTLLASEKVSVDAEGDTTALDALTAALEANDYDPTSSDVLELNITESGTYLSSILGVAGNASGGWMYALNDTSPWYGIDEQVISAEDEIVFYFLEDWMLTSYAAFDKESVTAECSEPFTLTLSRMEYDSVTWEAVLVPCSGATITIDDVESGYQTDDDGQATIYFTSPGSHTLSAVKYSGETNTIARSYCLVTVTGSGMVDENRLSQLAVSLTPSFTPEFTSLLKGYELEVDDSVSAFNLVTATEASTSTVQGRADWWDAGQTVSLSNSGGTYHLSGIPYGESVFFVTVIPADSGIQEQTYTITINRPNPVVLQDLQVSAGNLGIFDGEETSYAFTVANSIDQMTVTPYAHDAATVTVNGQTVVSGATSQAIDLEPGLNIISVVVSADGLQSHTYLINVTRSLPVPGLDLETKLAIIDDVLDTISASYQDTYDDWPVMDMAFYGLPDQVDQNAYLGVARNVIKNSTLATDLERVAIVLTALGYDASGFDNGSGVKVDMIDKIADLTSLGTMNGYLFALLAYDSGDYTVGGTWDREAVIDAILLTQIQSGSNIGAWRLSGASSADVDVTAMVISALAPYYSSDPQVKGAADAALAWLGAKQSDNGSFANSNSTAMVLIALTCLGYDGDSYFTSSVVDGLLRFVTADNPDTPDVDESNYIGASSNATKNALSTEQGFRALAAYRQYVEGEGQAVSPYQFNVPTKDGSGAVTVSGLTLEHMPDQTSYAIGEAFDPQGLIVSARYSDGHDETLDLDDLTFFGFDSSTSGNKTVKVSYEGTELTFQVTVRASSSGGGSDYAYIRVADPQGTTYLAKTKITIEDNETAFSLLTKTGLYYVADTKSDYGTYVQTIEDLSEFDVTAESGWMFSVNGVFPDISSDSYELKKGNYVEWLYTRNLGADLGDDSNNSGVGGSVTSTPTETQTPTIGTSFIDVPQGHWAYDAISYLVDLGILQGRSCNLFAPNEPVTRAEFVKILAATFAPDWQQTGDSSFTDVAAGAWFELYVLWAEESGITQGADGKFNPNAAISRQDLVVMIVRCLVAQKISLAQQNGTVAFTDGAQIASYAKDAVGLLTKAGVINGKGEGQFAPTDCATRAEAAKIIATLLHLIV